MPAFTFRQLEYFVAVADHGTMSAAAGELLVSESAVATALNEFERAVGAKLTVRRRAHGITLTTEGREALIHARTLLRNARELTSDVGRTDLAGTIRVGVYDTLAATLLPRLVRGFEELHPDVRIEAFDGPQSEIQRGVDEGTLDLAFLYDRDIAGTPQTATLYSRPAHVLLSAQHPLAGAAAVSFDDLREEPFIRFDVDPSWQHTRALMHAQGVTPRERFRTRNLELARSMVGQGLGYTVLVQRPSTDTTQDGSRVIVKEIDPPVPPIRVVAAWRRTDEQTPRAAEFIRYAQGAFAESPTETGQPARRC